MKKILGYISGLLAMLFLCGALMGTEEVSADTYSPVSVVNINYETYEMKIHKGNNPIVFFSTDGKKNWNEVDGAVVGSYVYMDIGWVSATSDVAIYLKGSEDKTVVKVELPKQNTTFKVKLDKVNDTFEFSNYDDRTYLWWRKSTDYDWHRVTIGSEASLNSMIPALRFKGCKLVFKLGQIEGSSASATGERPGKEVTVTVPKYAAAPAVTLNVTKLTLNTKDTMEYKLANDAVWSDCFKNMTLDDLVVSFANGAAGVDTTIMFRNKATEKKAVSLTTVLYIPQRSSAPTVGESTQDIKITKTGDAIDVTFYTASKTTPIEYCIIKPEDDFDEATAKWKTMTAAKTVTLKEKSVPAMSTLYFRYKGTQANASKKITLMLPSMYASWNVSY